MINPTGDEFNEEVPTSASADVGAFQTSNHGRSGTAINAWEQTKEKAGAARERTEIFVRSNPIPILLSALGIGIAIGLAIRYASSTAEMPPGLEAARNSPAHHAFACGSRERLGAKVSMPAGPPHSATSCWRQVSN